MIVIALWLLGLLIMIFCFVVFFGAPYVPTHKKELQLLLRELPLKKGAVVVDLGSGDGTLLILSAQKGHRVVGYEINPILWLISTIRLRKYPDARVILKSFWRADVSEADMVFTFLVSKHMAKLENTIIPQMKKGSYFASYVFALPNLQVVRKTGITHIYTF